MVVDSSALLAIALGEPEARRCMDVLELADELLISAGTVAEALIVADRRNVGQEVASLIDGLGFTIAPLTPIGARQVAEAYRQWGKGVRPAGLNLGDCFAYALAKEKDCALLFIGDEFSRTDLKSAL